MEKDQAGMVTTNFEKHTSKNPLKKFFFKRFENDLVSLIAPLAPEKILDAGCGEGFTLERLYELKIGKTLGGVDASAEAIEIGRKIYPHLNIKIGDIYKLPYENNSFDLVLCTEVLEHLEDPKKALSEIVRVSKKYLLFTVPNEPWFLLFNYTRWRQDIGHINHWSSGRFESFVKSQKLKVLRKVHPFPWTMVLAQKLPL